MRTLFSLLRDALTRGEDAVLVSVIASSGSTPRGAGACMLVTRAGRVYGTIGGGAVECRGEQAAAEVLAEKRSCLQFFRLNKPQDLDMVCGGDVHVYLRYIDHGDMAALALADRAEALFSRNEPSWLILNMAPAAGGALSLYGEKSGLFGAAVPAQALARRRACPDLVTAGACAYYRQPLVRAGRVFIFGGGHVAQALVPALTAVDFRCIVLEDRDEFCKPELFPGAEEIRLIDNNRVLDFVDIGESDYVAIMTRGHSFDLGIQAQVLNTPARYIGIIGSRQKIAKGFAALRALGFTQTDISRITAPIGLDIGAETPAEIAVSIAAQLIAIRAAQHERPDGRPFPAALPAFNT